MLALNLCTFLFPPFCAIYDLLYFTLADCVKFVVRLQQISQVLVTTDLWKSGMRGDLWMLLLTFQMAAEGV